MMYVVKSITQKVAMRAAKVSGTVCAVVSHPAVAAALIAVAVVASWVDATGVSLTAATAGIVSLAIADERDRDTGEPDDRRSK